MQRIFGPECLKPSIKFTTQSLVVFKISCRGFGSILAALGDEKHLYDVALKPNELSLFQAEGNVEGSRPDYNGGVLFLYGWQVVCMQCDHNATRADPAAKEKRWLEPVPLRCLARTATDDTDTDIGGGGGRCSTQAAVRRLKHGRQSQAQ